MKQTAVEWLVDQLKSTRKKYMGFKNIDIDYQEIIKQAKEMEKEQIKNAFVDGADKEEMFNNENRAFITDAEQYYNKTFKSE